MADLIQTKDPAIASYDYNDLADGYGIVTNYLSMIKDEDDTTINKIGRELIWSNPKCSGRDGDTGSSEYIFSTGQFNFPRIIEGDCILKYSWKIDSSDYNDWAQMSIQIFYNDGDTSTAISEEWSYKYESSGTYSDVNRQRIFSINRTKIKRGGSIEVKVILETYNGGNTHKKEVAFAHDPQNRSCSAAGLSFNEGESQFTIDIPFRVGV